MENKYLRHTDDEWLAIINQCRSSGDSDRIWCQEHHITLSTFYYQIRRLRKKACCIPEPVKSAGRAQEVVQIDFDTQERYPVPLSTVTSSETAVTGDKISTGRHSLKCQVPRGLEFANIPDFSYNKIRRKTG